MLVDVVSGVVCFRDDVCQPHDIQPGNSRMDLVVAGLEACHL
jgi:hypothetical protein